MTLPNASESDLEALADAAIAECPNLFNLLATASYLDEASVRSMQEAHCRRYRGVELTLCKIELKRQEAERVIREGALKQQKEREEEERKVREREEAVARQQAEREATEAKERVEREEREEEAKRLRVEREREAREAREAREVEARKKEEEDASRLARLERERQQAESEEQEQIKREQERKQAQERESQHARELQAAQPKSLVEQGTTNSIESAGSSAAGDQAPSAGDKSPKLELNDSREMAERLAYLRCFVVFLCDLFLNTICVFEVVVVFLFIFF